MIALGNVSVKLDLMSLKRIKMVDFFHMRGGEGSGFRPKGVNIAMS